MKFLAEMKVIMKGKLGLRLSRAFLVVGTLPLVAATIIAVTTATDALKRQSFGQLETARDIKKNQLEKLFGSFFRDVKLISSLGNVRNFFIEFENIALTEGVDNEYYEGAVKDYTPVLKSYAGTYPDMFLISRNGVVVYNFLQNEVLGTNLLKGKYHNSGLSAAFRKGLDGKVVFEDFSPYAPMKGVPAAFVASPIRDDGGAVIGVVALQVPSDAINDIMEERTGMGKTGETYLVGPDSLMRSNSLVDAVHHSVEASFADPDAGSVRTAAVEEALSGKTGKKIIHNYAGRSVLSAYTPVKIGNAVWALIAEVAEAEAFAAVKSLQFLMIAIIIVGVVAIVVVAVFMTRPIVGPIRQMVKYIDNVSEGDLSDTFEFTSDDEIGQMGHSLGKMSEYLQEMARTAENIARGDLGRDIHPKSDRDILGNAFREMVLSLREAITEVKMGSREINSAASEIASNSEQAAKNNEAAASAIEETTATMHEMLANFQAVAKNIQSQASSVAQTSASVEEMAASIKRIAETAKGLVALSQKAKRMVEKGLEAVDKSSRGMDEVNGSIISVTDTIAALGARAEDIGKIVDVIDDIAEQTNLLALNAAIEAARAGEQGLGFAVVADEVKVLAERSAKSTNEIAELISNIQKEVQNAVKLTEKATHLVDRGVELNKDVVMALNDIDGHVREVATFSDEIGAATQEQSSSSAQVARAAENLKEITEEISSATDEQASGAEQIVETIEKMKKMIHENASGAVELASSTEQLRAQADRFQKIVGRFILNGDGATGDGPEDRKTESTAMMSGNGDSDRMTGVKATDEGV